MAIAQIRRFAEPAVTTLRDQADAARMPFGNVCESRHGSSSTPVQPAWYVICTTSHHDPRATSRRTDSGHQPHLVVELRARVGGRLRLRVLRESAGEVE